MALRYAAWLAANGRAGTAADAMIWKTTHGVALGLYNPDGTPVGVVPPAIPTPPIPDSVTGILTQREALPDLYNPQRHTIAAGGAAQLEGQGYADPGTATISEQRAVGPGGVPGRDIRYFVFKGADGTLYRQAYLHVQNQGAQRGSLYTSGTADEQAAGKQRLDYSRQNILTGVDVGQTNLFNQQAGAYTDLTGRWQQGMEQYQRDAGALVQTQAPPPPIPPPVAPKPPRSVGTSRQITAPRKPVRPKVASKGAVLVRR